MKKADQKQKAREIWIITYEQLGSISKAARRCGIAWSTLQQWAKRLPQEGLADRPRRPYKLARQKWDDVIDKYDPDNEPILEQNYQWARKLGQL